MIMVYGASNNLLILGKPLFSNSNITVNYEANLIGLSNGKDLNPVKIDYTPRVIILFVTFTLIAGALGLLGK
jgi:hypothetical protein